ncbi:prepilin-type N-terminal cleavage/methylation domain-containing protein [Pseudothauera nasutitermitis]|uniref:Prepilin-type N-terminal cleavage/methylation domain-containing protein n=1 Tax=Pseudothauera nasutitermitis TaxID=2565930 RepID=A0A4S4AUV7_9RHOO|nr:prepilin-type N-terminal cleavage/methylation domain-containing protein [Pseudothauera nasutitermitis]THF63594.1 prepilin-type N-terminal cleavage/methylation domain-containing protein [Pseudothauera nasutitermitis]
MNRSRPPPHTAGFTLVELVIVIIILAILGGLTVGILLNPFQAFQDQANRAQLVVEADLALTRMVRELRMALPNSVRVGGGGQYIEFIPTLAGGRYRARPDPNSTQPADQDRLDFGGDTSFQILGPLLSGTTDISQLPGRRLVIYNASADGSSPASAYTPNSNWSTVNAFDPDTGILSFTSKIFPFASLESQRFDIVDTPVSFFCSNGTLWRADSYGFSANQPITAAAFNSGNVRVLAEGGATCTFAYQAGDHVRNGVASLRLTLTRNNETITLLYQAQVVNAP